MQTRLFTLAVFLSLFILPALGSNDIYTVLTGFPVTYSSKSQEQGCDIPRLDAQNKTWCPEVDDQEQWIQVSSHKPEQWTGVVTQGASHIDHWVTEYSVASTLDGKEWTDVDNGRVFTANSDSNTPVTNNFNQVVLARSLRIRIHRWHLHIKIRIDIKIRL